MVEFAHILRQQYILALANLVYKNVVIPVRDEVMYGSGAKLPECEAYIILTNQTSNRDQSTKCGENRFATIQIDIITKFSANSGAKLPSEEISALVQQRIRNHNFSLSGLNHRRLQLETERGLREDSDVHRIYRKILIFTQIIN